MSYPHPYLTAFTREALAMPALRFQVDGDDAIICGLLPSAQTPYFSSLPSPSPSIPSLLHALLRNLAHLAMVYALRRGRVCHY